MQEFSKTFYPKGHTGSPLNLKRDDPAIIQTYSSFELRVNFLHCTFYNTVMKLYCGDRLSGAREAYVGPRTIICRPLILELTKEPTIPMAYKYSRALLYSRMSVPISSTFHQL